MTEDRIKSSNPKILDFVRWLLGIDNLEAQKILKVVIVIEGGKFVKVRVTRYPTKEISDALPK